MGILKELEIKQNRQVLHCNDEMTQRLALLSFQSNHGTAMSDCTNQSRFTIALSNARLLQGDVGSVKLSWLLLVALLIISAGYQVALLAPTELLAEQHFSQFQKWWQDLGLTAVLLTGSQNKKKKEAIVKNLLK